VSRRRVTLRRLLIAATACALVLGGTLSALAYYTATGTGSASASVGTLAAPSITSTSAGAGTVSLSWSTVTPPLSGSVTYYVSRDGGAAGGDCASSSSPSSATSCTDSGVSVGTHHYTVTAVWRSWTATGASATAQVSYGPATQLVFTTQPAGATAGAAFSTQPVVTAQDALGNTVLNYTGTVALSIRSGTGPAGATLTGCSGSLSGGVTTFSGCEIDKAGSGYQLHASDGTRTADSSAFNVSPGPLSQLAFTTQPGGTITGGVAFPTQPVVTAEDAYGNTVTTYTGTVALSIKPGSPSGTLSGCSGVRSNGVTTFSGCKIDKAGSGYRLRASDGALTVDSASFNVLVGPAATLTLTPASTTVTAGAADNLTIKAFDAGGNLATGYTGAHGLTFAGASASPSGAQPTVTNSSGTAVAFGTATSISFASGQATVSGSSNGVMVLHKAETASITVTDGTVSTASGTSVTVNTGTASRLAWTHVGVSAGTLSAPCLFACTDTALGPNGTFTANASVTDSDGNTVNGLGAGHTVTVSTPTSGAGSGGAFTAPTTGTSLTLTIASSGAADSTAQFTFKAQTGSWTSDTFTAATASGTVYTSAGATVTKN
jgi:trimeric autotransporter adhesin